RQGIAFGIKQSAIPLATLLGGIAVPAITLSVGWRWTYVAGATFAVLAAALVVSDRRPGGAGPPVAIAASEEDAAHPDDPAHTVSEALLAERVAAWAPGRVARRRRRPLVVLAVGVGLGAAAAGALSQLLVS